MPRTRRYIYAIVIIACLFVLIPVQDEINRLKVESDLVETDIFKSMTPGELWGTLLIGGFRGIAVDILWVRAMNLQQDKKFFELITLFDLILQLQPHFRPVWAYSAWNLAYNVSHEYDDVATKWKWVQEGIKTLKKGIERNPKGHFLYFELGWIYFHKCDAEEYYKEQLRKQGMSNWLMAIDWFDRAIRQGKAPLYVERMKVHAYEKLYEEKQERQEYADLPALAVKILGEWEKVLERHPGDTIARDAYNAWKTP